MESFFKLAPAYHRLKTGFAFCLLSRSCLTILAWSSVDFIVGACYLVSTLGGIFSSSSSSESPNAFSVFYFDWFFFIISAIISPWVDILSCFFGLSTCGAAGYSSSSKRPALGFAGAGGGAGFFTSGSSSSSSNNPFFAGTGLGGSFFIIG